MVYGRKKGVVATDVVVEPFNHELAGNNNGRQQHLHSSNESPRYALGQLPPRRFRRVLKLFWRLTEQWCLLIEVGCACIRVGVSSPVSPLSYHVARFVQRNYSVYTRIVREICRREG